jgi:hypothetical protein
VLALRRLSQLSSNLRQLLGVGATVHRLWMVSSSSTWLRKCGGGDRRCRRRPLRRVVRLAIQPIWRARRARRAAGNAAIDRCGVAQRCGAATSYDAAVRSLQPGVPHLRSLHGAGAAWCARW